MRKIILLAAAFSGFCYITSAQSWLGMMHDGHTNVHDVQNAFKTWYTQQPVDSDARAKEGENEDNDSYIAFKRWEWYMLPRTYPSGNIPDYATISSQYEQYMASRATQRTERVQNTANWSYVGNATVPSSGGGAGRINRVRFMPGKPDTMFACAPSGGLWESTNGGASWSTKTDQLLDIGASDIAIDPTNTNIMYLATGDDDHDDVSGTGVLKSTDGGNTWNVTGLYFSQSASGPFGVRVTQLLLNPVSPNILIASSKLGIFYSSDAGSSWTNVLPGINFRFMEFMPGHPEHVYAASLGGALFRSLNGGITWTQITNGLPPATFVFATYQRIDIAVTPSDTNCVYAVVSDSVSSGLLGVYISLDGGTSFRLQATSPNVVGSQGWYALGIAVSQTSASTLIVGGLDNYVSSDSGVTWTQVSSWTGWGSSDYVHADVHSLDFMPGSNTNIIVGCDGGVFKSTNQGTTWTDLSNNLAISQQYSIGPSANNSNLWLTGWQDNGTNSSTSGWSKVMGGDGMVCFIDYSDATNSNMFAEYYNGNIWSSNDGGNNWNYIEGNISENGPWVTEWLQDPANSNTLFAGYENVWMNTAQGNVNWTQISSWGYNDLNPGITAIAVEPTNDNDIYAAEADSIFYTSNQGTTWTNITGTLPTGQASITSIAVSATNPSRVWVGLSGYSNNNKVFYSSNAGATWTNISTNLPNLPVNCLLYQPGSPDGIYAGTDRGVYYRDTAIGTWVSYNNNLPNVVIDDLKFAANGNLLAATYGRGTWVSSTYTPPVAKPTVYFSGYPRAFCIADTVQYTDSSLNQPDSWHWRFQGGNPATSTLQNPSVIYNAPGTFSVTLVATNANGTDSSTVSNFISVYALTAPSINQSGSTLTCTPSGMGFYQWYTANGTPILGATASTYNISSIGRYICSVTNTNGCSDTVSYYASVVTGLNNISPDNYMSIYPNPTNGNVQIVFNMPQADDYNFNVTDVLGQVVYSGKMHIDAGYSTTLNMSDYSKGVYFFTIENKSIKSVKKVVVY